MERAAWRVRSRARAAGGRSVATCWLAATLLLVATSTSSARTFVFGFPAEPVQLDPAVVADGVSLAITHQLFEGLVRLQGETTMVEPALAERWQTSPDGLSWTFHLRRGVRFHDGDLVDAAAVAWNVDRWRHSTHPQHQNQVRAGQTFEYWESLFGGFDEASVVSRVEVLDPVTVRLRLREPQGAFLANLAVPGLAIASPRAVERWGTAFGKHPVGSGPFRFVEWQPGQRVVLEANPDYWDGPPRISRVVALPIKDNARRLAALKSGEIHAMEGLNPNDVQVVRRDPGLYLRARPANTTGYLAFNYRVRELRDRRIRLAFAQAIDKRALVTALYGGTGVVATQFQPPSFWGHDPDLADHPHDPARARALLAEAGSPGGLAEVTWDDGSREPLTLWYMPVSRPYFPNPKEIAEALGADLGRAGIRARLRTADWAVYLDRVKHGRLALYMLGWIGDNSDPDNALCYVFCAPGSASQGFYENPALSALLRQARAGTEPSGRAALYRRAERMLHADVARLFIAHNETPLAFSLRVSGYVVNPTGAESFRTVEVR